MRSLEVLQSLQDSQFASIIRGGTLVYPWVNTLHVIGIALLVGSTLAFDARLLGFGKAVSVDGASSLLMPFMVFGLTLAILTGFPLFASDAVSLSRNSLMLAKLILALLGVVNAIAFRLLWTVHLKRWDAETPSFGRMQAIASVAIWLSVAALGRLVAYF